MGGESVQDPQDLDDLQVADDDLDVIDQIDGDVDDDAEGDLSVLTEKFKGDPEALAKAYMNLQRKFGQQGTEVGELRGELRAAMQMMTARTTDADTTPDDPGEAFLADLEQQVSSGEIKIVDAFRKMIELSKSGNNTPQVAPGNLSSEDRAEVWEDFKERNPVAKRLEPLIGKIIREQPNLIRLDKGERGLRKSLATILELAQGRYDKAKGRDRKRGGRMDTGTSRRVRRPSSDSSVRGRDGSRFTNEQFNEAIDGARQDGSLRSWSKPVGMILDTMEGFDPDQE